MRQLLPPAVPQQLSDVAAGDRNLVAGIVTLPLDRRHRVAIDDPSFASPNEKHAQRPHVIIGGRGAELGAQVPVILREGRGVPAVDSPLHLVSGPFCQPRPMRLILPLRGRRHVWQAAGKKLLAEGLQGRAAQMHVDAGHAQDHFDKLLSFLPVHRPSLCRGAGIL